jgi:hypothetical protein
MFVQDAVQRAGRISCKSAGDDREQGREHEAGEARPAACPSSRLAPIGTAIIAPERAPPAIRLKSVSGRWKAA